jgi:hypothetical protein
MELAELVNRSVQVDPSSRGCDVGFVDEPPLAWGMPAGSSCVDEQRGEPRHSPVHAHVIDGDAALSQQLLDVAVGERVAQIPAHRHQDHIRRERNPAKPDCDGGTRQGDSASAQPA